MKAIYDIGPGYLKECLSPVVSVPLVCLGRVGVDRVSSPNVAMFWDLGFLPSLSWLSSYWEHDSARDKDGAHFSEVPKGP